MVRIERGIDPAILVDLYADPLIQRVGDDLHPAGPVDHELAEYVSVFNDDEFVGAFLVIDFSAYEYEVHVLLQKSATKASREACRLLLDMLFSDENKQRVTGWVGAHIPTSVNYCKRMGLEVEGQKRNAIRIDGVPMDVVMVGITREKWYELNR